MKLAALICMSIGIQGCATEPKIVYQPYETRVPIPVPCVVPAVPEPEWAGNQMPRVDPVTGEGMDVAAKKLLAEREQRRGYEDQLRKAQSGCK